MTNEEAIKTIELAIAEVEWNYPMNYAIAFETAIYAIEKQIPKKPIPHIVNAEKIKIGNVYWGKGTTIYYCPNCKDFISRMYTYCHKCGQKLLWE